MSDPTIRGTRPLTLPTTQKKDADPKTETADKPAEAAQKPAETAEKPAATVKDRNDTGPLADPASTRKGTGLLTDPAVTAGSQVPAETKAAVEKEAADYKQEAEAVAKDLGAADTPEKIEAAQKRADALAEKFKQLHPNAQDQVKSTFDKVAEMNEAAKGVLETVKGHGDNVDTAVGYLTDPEKQAELKGQMDKLKGAVAKVSPAAAEKMADTAGKLVKAMGADKIREFLQKGNKLKVLEKLLGATGVVTSLSSLGSNMKGLVDAFRKGDSAEVARSMKALMGDLKGVAEGLGKLGGMVGDLMKGMPEKFKQILGPLGAAAELYAAGKDALAAFGDTAQRTYRSVAEKAAAFVEKLGNFVGSLPVPQLKVAGSALEWGGWGAGLAASWAPSGFMDEKF